MLILGSNSSGRKYLLEQVTKDFVVIPSDFDEDELKSKNYKPSVLVKKLSLGKLNVLIKQHKNDVILCADTVVYQDKTFFGKPLDNEDAINMLKKISSKPHFVYSGVAIYKDGVIYSFYDKTKVIFKHISIEDINNYVSSGQSNGKAGSYGIQSINDKFIKKVVGDFSTVIGMPLEKVIKIIFNK
ncbi:MAG: Maf family protein [Acholeplasmatales bacterium]|jgi:septum formation protein|nr:Maf family protein [Acholeplasmatales bacterium]